MPIEDESPFSGMQFATLLDSESATPEPPKPPCTAEDDFPNLMIEKHDCDSNEPWAQCMAFYSGDVTDRLRSYINWNNYEEDLITALYPD